MALSANGSTVSFGGTGIGGLVDISFSESGQRIEGTNLADTINQFEVGTSEIECQITVNGNNDHGVAVGDTGAISVTWNDSSSDSIGAAVCTDVETSGSLNGAIQTTLTFVPHNTDGS